MKPKKKESSPEFAALISQAQKAVLNVKDERLREIAFERVLDHLLSGSSGENTSPSAPRSATRRSIPSKTETKPATGTLAWLTELHEEGFFKKPKCLKDILQELTNRSHTLKSTDLTWPLEKLCHDRKLRRNQQAPAKGGRKVFHWYNW